MRLWGVSRIGNSCRANEKVYEKSITVAKGLSIAKYDEVWIVMSLSSEIFLWRVKSDSFITFFPS